MQALAVSYSSSWSLFIGFCVNHQKFWTDGDKTDTDESMKTIEDIYQKWVGVMIRAQAAKRLLRPASFSDAVVRNTDVSSLMDHAL